MEKPGAGALRPDAIDLSLPFTGTWTVQNSPARRVPSHGTNLFGVRYAIDFVAIDDRGRTAPTTSWRTVVGTEPPELFFAFGMDILAPISGMVRAVHDGEVDHEARRSQPALLAYALTQPRRVRQGPTGVAGNHLVIEDEATQLFVAVVHLQRGSIAVRPGDSVRAGQVVARCGNSGNSTQPHVHLQVMDSLDLRVAKGVPLAFRDYEEKARGADRFAPNSRGVPAERSIVRPIRSDTQV